MNDLYSLRSESYEMAGRYCQAQSQYLASLRHNNREEMATAAQQVHVTGEGYKFALQKLIDYLISSGTAAAYKDELLRGIGLLDILERELKSLPVYQAEDVG